ncbi:MAG: kynureninase [Chlamydiales bacterium]|jgi:kynureninase
MQRHQVTGPSSIEYAEQLDKDDPLASFRQQFFIPTDSLYFAGNSLGLQAKGAADSVFQELQDWQALGVEGHFKENRPWLPYHELLTDKMAKIVGAKSSEVVVMNSLTANLHLMMVSFYRPSPECYKILVNPHMFPSDQYALQSQLRYYGFDPEDALITLPSHNGLVEIKDLEDTLEKNGSEIALIWMEGVNYYSGQALPMKKIAELGHSHGCTVGFDLAHAAGNIPLKLHDDNIDFAVWCTYKYLNGGPGCPGACFVHERHHDHELERFAGWWGHNKGRRFLMEPNFDPINGAEGWQLSNPPILSLAALLPSLDLFEESGMSRLNEKSEKLHKYMRTLLKTLPSSLLSVITPEEESQHGCQLSIRFEKNGLEYYKKLKDSGIIGDWREPDVLRIAPVPLYNSFVDLFHFFHKLKEVTS